MAKGRSGRSGRSGGNRSHGARRTGGVGHRTHHHTPSRSAFSRRNHRTNLHTTTGRPSGGVLRVSGGSSRNNPKTLLILGGVFSLIAIAELIACLVLGVLMATCVKQPKQDNCPVYDSIMIPLGASAGILLVMGVLFILLSIRMIIQRRKMAAMNTGSEIGLANVSVMQLETGETVQQHPMIIENTGFVNRYYFSQPNPMMMNYYQYPPNNATVIPPNQQQPIYYNNFQSNIVAGTNNTSDASLQYYNHNESELAMTNNHGMVNPNISNQQFESNESIQYSMNYRKSTCDNEAPTTIYIPSPQAPPQPQQQQHDDKV
ncbi:predicted protein [Naegleria gruberi]|uniref:Predicted protein n=1 Tax=Naegleria gruberi TaxID=5762 RepID=D2VXK8_NAEGR|nr:uncharacterized protein NAEGRDRAFT_53048 [Naegleria gruberi]EFC38525.1 predicted protein [Naegleria gruberi]|eukprot:XP_002671269.1 predicted protein [Naegleria gruberi strain NEG-M]